MNITQDLKFMLEESGWTQERLAQESGIHPVTISKLIRRLNTGDRSALGKILPFIYGDKRPPAKEPQPPEPQP